MEKKKEKAEKCNVLYIVALVFFLLFFNRRRPLVVADRNVPIGMSQHTMLLKFGRRLVEEG